MQTTRYVYFVGPTCVGKGFILKLLVRALHLLNLLGLAKIGFITFGDIIKGLLETDPSFNEKYGPSVKAGDLIDDPKAIELFQKEVDRLASGGAPDLIFVDGFGRSTPQIAYAAENGYLGKGSMVFMIEASLQTCLDRFLHRKAKSDKPRIDAEVKTFHKRYHLHADATPELRAMFKETDCELIDIDGDPDIAEHVFPRIMGHLLPAFAQAIRGQEAPKATPA